MIKVYPGGRVEVVVPRRTRAADVQTFVQDNAAWIENAREAFAADYPSDAFALPETIRLPSIGRKLSVRYRPRPGATTVRYSLGENVLVLSGKTDDEQLCVRALRRCLSAIAKEEFAPRLRSLALLISTSYKRMQIRAQRTCWGSRSSSGTVSLNVCLLFLEPTIVRYLLIHELCHGRQMDHSQKFWKLVEKYEPDYRRLDRKLTESWRRVPPWMGVH